MNPLTLLDRPIAFHRCLVDVTGSITAALLLSQALYWQRRVPKHRQGWWFKSQAEWREETGLSRYEQESARKTLRRLDVLQEQRRGVPATLWYRVNETVLAERLAALPHVDCPVCCVWNAPRRTRCYSCETVLSAPADDLNETSLLPCPE